MNELSSCIKYSNCRNPVTNSESGLQSKVTSSGFAFYEGNTKCIENGWDLPISVLKDIEFKHIKPSLTFGMDCSSQLTK